MVLIGYLLCSSQLSIPHLQIHKLRWSTHNYLRRLLRKMAWINWGSGSATIECNVYPCTCNGTLHYNGEKSHQFFQVYRISLLPSQFYDHYYSFFGTEFLKSKRNVVLQIVAFFRCMLYYHFSLMFLAYSSFVSESCKIIDGYRPNTTETAGQIFATPGIFTVEVWH